MATHSSGSTKVTVDTRGVDRLAARIRRRGVAAAARALGEEVEAVVERARARWGRDTGEGARSLGVKVEVRDTRIVVRAFSTDPTARFHRASGSRSTYWAQLVSHPLRQLRQRFLERAAEAMAEEARRG